MKKVLIIGGNGFIGAHLVRHLGAREFEVHVVQRVSTGAARHEYLWDGADPARIASILEHARADILIHLIARTGSTRNLQEVDLQYTSTVRPAALVAQSIPPATELSLFFGSSEEYGDGPSPAREDQALRAISPYGWAKISAGHAVGMIAKQRELRVCWVRPYLTFGPGQAANMLIPEVIQSCLNDREIKLTAGRQTRDLIYVGDICRMVERMLANTERAHGQTLNLCTGTPRRVGEVATLIQSLIGKGRLLIGALPYRVREIMEFHGSPEKFIGLFGEVPLTPHVDAIKATIESYR